MNIKYAIIPPLGQSPVQTSEARTMGISEEWLKLTTIEKKPENVTQFLMGWISNADAPIEFAVIMDMDYLLSVSNGFNTGYLFQLYGQSVSGQERAEINAKLNAAEGSKIAVSEIIPQSWVLYTEAEMRIMGWIVDEII